MFLPEPNDANDYFKRHQDVDATTFREAGITYHVTPWGLLDDFEYLEYLRERFDWPNQQEEEPSRAGG